MPSVKEELEALRKQNLAKTHATKLAGAGGRGLSTPEQEAAQIKDINEKKRVGNYTKDAKETLKAGTKAVAQDWEFNRQLAAQKREDKVKQSEAKQTLAAGAQKGAVDKTTEFQQQSKAFKLSDKEKQKQATANLQQFNEAKIKATSTSGHAKGAATAASASAPTPASTAAAAATATTAAAAAAAAAAPATSNTGPPLAAAKPEQVSQMQDIDHDVEEEDVDDDDIPTLEEVPDLATTAAENDKVDGMMGMEGAAASSSGPRVQNRSEKKARKVMEKLNMRPVSGITRVTLKSAGNQGFFTIQPPFDVYEKNGSYIIFGEARQGNGILQQQQQQAQQQAKAAQELAAGASSSGAADATTASPGASAPPEILSEADTAADADETGIDAKDIDLVIQQAGCSRAKAVEALKQNNGDLVNAIMFVTK